MPSQNVKIITSIIITAVIVGGGVYFLEKNQHIPALVKTAAPEISTTTVSSAATPTSTEKIIDQKNIDNQEVLLLSTNAIPKTDDSCAKGYLNGTFTLVVRDSATKKIIDQMNLEQIEVTPHDALHLAHMMHNNKTGSFATVAQYGTCNGDLFAVYALPNAVKPTIRSIIFTNDDSDNEMFADKPRGLTFAGGTTGESYLVAEYYDNVAGKNKIDTYTWDGNISFEKDKK